MCNTTSPALSNLIETTAEEPGYVAENIDIKRFLQISFVGQIAVDGAGKPATAARFETCAEGLLQDL